MPQPGKPLIEPQAIELALATLQQRIDQLQSTLQQQQKLATLGMVTAVIAHEFNNILTPMIAYTKYALSDKADDELRAKALAKALAGSEKLANISHSLLGFARTDPSTSVLIAHALRETLACLSRDLSKDGISLTTQIPEDLAVAMNAGQFQQVLMNLILNARSALLTPANASSSRRPGPKRLTITAAITKRNKIGEIRITDSGPGIPPHILPKIFEPFFSTKPPSPSDSDELAKGGTGLGLAICQELISASGGTIRAENTEPSGASFIIELPLASPPSSPQTP